MPALDRDNADVITGSEHILKAHADKRSLTATAIVDLIKNVLKNPEFNADDVDTDMLQRLQDAIESGDLQVIIMHKDGDGPHVLEFFARPVEKVLRELIGDLHLAGRQHFAFHEYKDALSYTTSNPIFYDMNFDIEREKSHRYRIQYQRTISKMKLRVSSERRNFDIDRPFRDLRYRWYVTFDIEKCDLRYRTPSMLIYDIECKKHRYGMCIRYRSLRYRMLRSMSNV